MVISKTPVEGLEQKSSSAALKLILQKNIPAENAVQERWRQKQQRLQQEKSQQQERETQRPLAPTIPLDQSTILTDVREKVAEKISLLRQPEVRQGGSH